MSEATQTQTLEQTLNKTDFGHVLYENRKAFLGLLVAILVAVAGWIFWKESQNSKALNVSVKVFEFQSNEWENAKAGKLSQEELLKVFNALDKDVQMAPVMIPVVLEIGKFLYEKGSYAEAEGILSKVDGTVKHPVTSFFVGMQRAVVLEKLGKTDEAITVLENLSKTKDAIMPAKVSVELGRLYLAKGEKGKAQTQFDSVISTYPNDDQAKIAKLYLSQLSK